MSKRFRTCLTAGSQTGELTMDLYSPDNGKQQWARTAGGQFFTAAYGRSRVMSTVGGSTGYSTRLRLEEDRQAAHQKFTFDGTFIQLANTNMIVDANGGNPGGSWPMLWNKEPGSEHHRWNAEDGVDQAWLSADAMPSWIVEKDRLLLNLVNYPYRSTGLYADPGEVKISVRYPTGGCAMAYIGAPDTTTDERYKAQRAYLLHPGLNSIVDAGGGMLYVGLVAPSGRVSIASVSGTRAATRFILGETTPEQYRNALVNGSGPAP
ncbi:M60 family peptidase N-terminal accessory domain-containing protein [Streptomyces lavendulae]|uniref:M60 family peptidase N-terminal accessory domain-containing protein n=1 Tax=Streptomyces lavendulae TaxID=1914 RepID=UPI00369D47C1